MVKNDPEPDYEMLEKLEAQVERLRVQLEESNFTFQSLETPLEQERLIDLIVLSLTEEGIFNNYAGLDYLLDAIDDIIRVSKYCEKVTYKYA